MDNNILLAFSLTLIAGLATGLGSATIFFTNVTNKKFLSFSLGLSAGVMLYVSFVEILVKSVDSLSLVYGEKLGNIYAILGFFIGILLIALIDKLMPNSSINIAHLSDKQTLEQPVDDKKNLMRMGIFTAIAISIHNFPEGLATFVAALEDPNLGFAITTAIAIHNIPEGIAVAIPIFYATGSKTKAFFLSLLSGLTEPIGALVGYFVFIKYFDNETFGFIFAAVAGIMVYISLDELLPSADEYGEHNLSILGAVIGMAIMAISLILFI